VHAVWLQLQRDFLSLSSYLKSMNASVCYLDARVCVFAPTTTSGGDDDDDAVGSICI
jgi:hypothetical protein